MIVNIFQYIYIILNLNYICIFIVIIFKKNDLSLVFDGKNSVSFTVHEYDLQT